MKQLLHLEKAWWQYYKKHKDTLRPVVIETMGLLMACGTLLLGFATFRCPKPGCFFMKKVCFGCNSRFCNTCGKKKTDQWLENMKATLPDTPWQHITFTMPDVLWRFFEVNRHLQGNLSAIAARIMLDAAKKKGLIPGIFNAIHTFDRDLKLPVHIHLAITLGGITTDHKRWKKIDFHKINTMTRWRYLVIDLLRQEAKKGQLIIPEELSKQCGNNYRLNQFLDTEYEKHWHVHFADPTQTPTATAKYLGRYLTRPPIALSRIKHYDGKEVVFEYLDHKTNTHRLFRCDTEEFITRLIRHIPEKGFRLVRYYGFLAHRVRGQLLPKIYDLLNQPEKKAQKIYFPELLKATFSVDPLECQVCLSQLIYCGITVGMKRSELRQYHKALALQKPIQQAA